ncbi:DUF916 and DUF3324 domain-containing protein [Carnobacterium maltaromaticum]|uniref:DUF916 and DUF3324 domain-containing protein n=1 Tax=Carnobacterium maltaromaticum TaxID=2751 RepID=UPI0012FBE05F|nr:DUF916 and DUF3324 domain-containing protein [Carnobacterium maltaromaticum]
MTSLKRWLIGMMSTLLLIFVAPVVQAGGMNFTVEPLFNEHQIAENQSHFEMKVEPNSSEKVSIQITNGSDKDKKFSLQINNATTSNNGEISYEKKLNVPDDSAQVDLQTIATLPHELSLKGGESRIVDISFEIPEQTFEGVILGGLQVMEQNEGTEQADEKISFKNKYSFIVPIVIYETDAQLKADVKLKKVFPTLTNAYPSLEIQLQNPVATTLPTKDVTVKITPKNKKEVLKEQQLKEVTFAPNSTWNNQLDWEKEEFKAGDYTAHIKIKSEYGDWKWDKDFTIAGTKAKELNKKAVGIKSENSSIFLIVGILLMFLVTIVLMYMLTKEKRKNQLEK